MAAALALAACGSSAPRRAASSRPAHPPAASSRPAPAPTTSAAPAASYPQTTSRASTAGATGVLLPATFTIEPGGGLSPPSITAPAGVAVLLTLISADGKAHRVGLGHEAWAVPPGGRTRATISGLARGRHTLVVDGAPRGALIVGGSPGP